MVNYKWINEMKKNDALIWIDDKQERHDIVFDFIAIKQINTFSAKSVLRDYHFEIMYKLKTI